MRLFLLLLLASSVAQAETLRDLSQNNASPEEIIQKLNTTTIPSKTNTEKKEPVQVGTVVSLIHHQGTPFYDFTVALSDDRVVTVSDANHLKLKPGDMVILSGNQDFWRIKSKFSK